MMGAAPFPLLLPSALAHGLGKVYTVPYLLLLAWCPTLLLLPARCLFVLLPARVPCLLHDVAF